MNTNTMTHDTIVASKVSDLLYKEKKPGGLVWIALILAAIVCGILFLPRYETTDRVYESCVGTDGEVSACRVEMSFKLKKNTEPPVLKKGTVKVDENTVQAYEGLKSSYSYTNYQDRSYFRMICLDIEETRESAVFIRSYDTMGIYDAEGNLLLIATMDPSAELPPYPKLFP